MPKIESVNRIPAAGNGAINAGEAGELGCPGAHPATHPTPETGYEEPNNFHMNQNDRRNG
ncbi:hypothetical protein JXL21_08690 [Candidatus Bathyarchaeota archaeon]|nr:hypothetical protein [Candidatus Bathyarchaeota archaeon]